MAWSLMGVFVRLGLGPGSPPSSLSFLFPPFTLSHTQSLRHGLQKTKEQVRHQEQLLKEQEEELKTLQEQLSR